jgi:hypothetical protein
MVKSLGSEEGSVFMWAGMQDTPTVRSGDGYYWLGYGNAGAVQQ